MLANVNYTISVRADSRALHYLSCSVEWGCEVTVPTSQLQDIKLTDSRFAVSKVVAGPSVRVVLLPSSALVDDGGVVHPLRAMLRVIYPQREYDVLLTARDIQQSYNMEFSAPVRLDIPPPPPSPPPTPSPAELENAWNPAEINVAWSQSGPAKHRCAALFEYRGSLYCRLTAASVPEVYAVEGHLQRPLNTILVDGGYLKVASPAPYMRMVWGEEPGSDVWIREDP